ncbi:MAG: RNase adapter RapZ [Acidobacteria bacterium]|nr:RNase adapter RapZ [Acidobacteriota bacterium]
MSLTDLVIVTGMSGSGKGTVLKAFEDLGFFCIDNLPVALIPKFIEGIHVSGGEVERAALGIDIRAGEQLRDLARIISDLRVLQFRVTVMYLEARDSVLVRRFSETRRPHPLSADKPLPDAIRLERHRLRPIREMADTTIDTSTYSIHEVKALVMDRFRSRSGSGSLTIHLLSFGFKHGVPLEADLMFDVRFLPNPYFAPGLRSLSGRHRRVARYLLAFPETREFIRRLSDFVTYLIPFYVREGKSYLTVAIGCTGGRHRSVFAVEQLARSLRRLKPVLKVRHRDESK